MKCLVDTNILIDYYQNRIPFAEPAELLLALGMLKELDLWMSSSQITDTYFILSEGGKRSLASEARGAIKSARKCVRVCAIGGQEIDAALDSPWEDFEDACVYQAALKVKADAIVTRNKTDFVRSSINVFDCDELFAYLKQEKGLDYGSINLQE